MSVQLLEPGFRLGRYEVVSHLATGGMAVVYKAMDVQLRRLVALKVLDPTAAAREEVRERFKREARHAARLTSKYIVTIYEANEDQGYLYLAMELIPGLDLESYIHRKGRLGAEEARRILIQAVKALDHAHRHGMVHRDIKPSNFLLAQREEHRFTLKLTDLGLARIAKEDEFRVTRAGYTVGTIDYMSPEQARDSSSADIRSDLYSLGCTAYHMLAGRPPFAEGGLGERLYKHLEEAPPDLRQIRPDVSAAFWGILQRLLAKDRAERYQTPTELLLDLKRTPADASQEAPPLAGALRTRTPLKPLGDKLSSDELVDLPPLEPSPEQTEDAALLPPPEVSQATQLTKQPAPTPEPMRAAPDETARPGSPGLDQGKAAAGQFERARQLLAQGGDSAYPRQLLVSCCKLDPGNITYRATLRQAQQGTQQGGASGWFGSLNALALTTRLKSAQRNGEHRKVLEQGEEILARYPADVSTHLVMAESAEALGFNDLAIWLLEQGRKQVPDNTVLMRALAWRYEKERQLSKSIALWELVQKAEPEDYEVQNKINSLTVSEHISKAQYRRR